jgi:hypothetical protein
VKKKLYVSQIEDPFIQQNFKTFGEIFNGSPFLKGQWRFIEFQVTKSGTNVRIEHKLSFVPIDVIVTSVQNGTISFKYANFDTTYIVFDATVTTAPMTVRAMIGRYTEETIGV